MTAFFAGTTGLLQNDLKRVIAYSTCSQLGYMVFACGLSAYNVGVFHLANHAFFKALLFLSAGSVIHAVADEQDMRRMGGLVRVLPFTYAMFFIGSIALMGFPFLTGFYSKDVILEIAYAKYTLSGHFAHWFGCLWYWVGAQDWCKLSCYENQGANSDGACSWIDASDLGKKNPMCCGCSVVVVVAVVRFMVHT